MKDYQHDPHPHGPVGEGAAKGTGCANAAFGFAEQCADVIIDG